MLTSAAGLAASFLLACAAPRGGRFPTFGDPGGTGGGLRARPRAAGAEESPVGLQPLGLEAERDGLVFVPSRYQRTEPLPLVLMLHGAGGSGTDGLSPFQDRAEEAGIILIAPDSRRPTWDVLLGGYGADVAFVDRALEQTFRRYSVDPRRVAVEGFSDGASYALGLGVANGDLFGKIVAFSPGFAPPSRAEGRPAVFVSHGTADDVLPIDRCSRRIVPALKGRGYDVRYREFEGGHEIPTEIVDDALAWLLKSG